ncbi:MAG: NAD-dependent epimerase/dehydratase family protein [Gemmatimonadetes bacterium]|nr:NAD-dependent epimerase/dehydratase family protein [Gemmatimonadota bacterium]
MGSRDGGGPAGVRGALRAPSPASRRGGAIPGGSGPLNAPGPLLPGGRVFLTGGSGLVGSHVAEVLRREGHPVRAFHRRGSDVGHLRELGCELLEGALPAGEPALAAATRGCEAVVHAAALIYTDLSWPRVRAVNVEGSANVFRAAAAAGVRRAVFLSSVAAYGDPAPSVDERTPLDGRLHPWERYARSKREGERVISEIAGPAGMAVAVLRPSAIYGERDRLFTPKIASALRFPIHPMLGGGRTPMSAVYAGNVAAAVLAGLRGPLPVGTRAYNVADDYGLSQRELYSGLARELGVPFRPVSLPRVLVQMGASLGVALGMRIPGAEELPLRRAAHLAIHSNPYLSERIREELGWSPAVPSEEALRRTAAWIARIWGAGGNVRFKPVSIPPEPTP